MKLIHSLIIIFLILKSNEDCNYDNNYYCNYDSTTMSNEWYQDNFQTPKRGQEGYK